MTLKEIREDLQEIRYYFTHKAAFDNAVKLIGTMLLWKKSNVITKYFSKLPPVCTTYIWGYM